MASRKDFYNDRSRELSLNFLADYRVVRQYFCKKYGYSQAEIETIWKLHELKHFINGDIDMIRGVFGWNFDELMLKLKRKGAVVVWREVGPGQTYRIFSLSRNCKGMVKDFYKILCGEIPLPESLKANPIMRENTYMDKKYATAIRDFNLRMASKKD